MAKQKSVSEDRYKSRIKTFIPSFPTDKLIEHPENWRIHPEEQQLLLKTMLARTGKIDAILCYDSELHGGRVIIDGHQRKDVDKHYPVIVLDVTDEEAREILVSYNPVSAMASVNTDAYRAIMSGLDGMKAEEEEAVRKLQAFVLNEKEQEAQPNAELKDIDTTPPPKMAWVVIGIPIQDYGSVAKYVEAIGEVKGAIVEATSSNFRSDEVSNG